MNRTPPTAPAAVAATAARAIAFAFALCATAALAGTPAPAHAAGQPEIRPATSADAVAMADRFYAGFDFEAALSACRAGLAVDSTSYDLQWRLARSLIDRGARAEYDKNKPKAEAAYGEAVAAGRRAVVLDAAKPEGHLELAVALGRLALFKGGKDKIRLSKEIKSEVDRALAIDPKQDRAEHVLARWNRGIAELNFFEKAAANTILGGLPKGATMDEAVTHFEKAIALESRLREPSRRAGTDAAQAGAQGQGAGRVREGARLPAAHAVRHRVQEGRPAADGADAMSAFAYDGIVLVEGVRTPFVKAGGPFAGIHAAELGRLAIGELLARTGFDPARVDEVILGNCGTPPDAANIARVAALEAGVPAGVPAFTVHRNCASGIESIAEAAARIAAGRASAVIAGGTESMSNYPLMMGPRLTEAFAASSRGRDPLAHGWRRSPACAAPTWPRASRSWRDSPTR